MIDGFVLVLLLALAAVIGAVSWIGWRFFIAPCSVAGSTVVSAQMAVDLVKCPGVPGASEWSGRVRGLVRQSALALLVSGGGVAAVISFSEFVAPEPLTAQEMERQQHIQVALNPERLVPPPALPPSLFVGSERPALEFADRDWAKLNPRFAQSVLQVLARLRERGYDFALLEGYRSPERQNSLADIGSHVTSARAFQSKHQFGFAADLAPLRGGRLVISERDPWAMQAYSALGEEAGRAGLTWGGRWWFKDFGHVEASGSVPVLARLTDR